MTKQELLEKYVQLIDIANKRLLMIIGRMRKMTINTIYNAINKFFDSVKDENSIICTNVNVVITVDSIRGVIVVTVRDGNRATSEYIPIDGCINDVAVGIAIAKSLIEMGVEL